MTPSLPSILFVAAAAALLSSCDGSSSASTGNTSPSPQPVDTSKSSSSGDTSSSPIPEDSSNIEDHGVPWNGSITYGRLIDTRDGQVYRTVKIGWKTWMAQNLNFRGTKGRTDTVGACYDNRTDSCAKHGRLYTWADVMQGSGSSTSEPSGVKGVCPTGWHVPSDNEWGTLLDDVDASGITVGTQLKSTWGWDNNSGTDTYGFRALPSGLRGGGIFRFAGSNGGWWTATAYDGSSAKTRYLYASANYASRGNDDKSTGLSLRCTMD